MIYLLRCGLTILLVLSLASCALFYDVKVDKPSTYVKPVVVDPTFNISGRFFIKTSDNSSKYGNFTWDKSITSESLAFRTPIGQTVALISIESGVANLETSTDIYEGEDLDEIMEKQLGFTLPLSLLHYWIQGVMLPNVPITDKLTDGFVQLGWTVEYLEWQDSGHPKIIQCSKNNLLIKLVLEW